MQASAGGDGGSGYGMGGGQGGCQGDSCGGGGGFNFNGGGDSGKYTSMQEWQTTTAPSMPEQSCPPMQCPPQETCPPAPPAMTHTVTDIVSTQCLLESTKALHH